MENIKKIYEAILNKVSIGKINIKDYWKLTVVVFISLFLIIIFGGWVLYIHITTNSPSQLPTKTIRSEITMGDIEKVKEIAEDKQNRLNEAIKNDVNIKGLR